MTSAATEAARDVAKLGTTGALLARWARMTNKLGQRHATAIGLMAALPLASLYANRGGPAVLALTLLCTAVSRCEEDLPPARRSWTIFRQAITGNAFVSLLMLAIAYSALSALWAIEPGAALERAGKLLLLCLLGIALFKVTPPMGRDWYRPLGLAALGGATILLAVELGTSGIFRESVHGAGSPIWLMNRAVVVTSLLMWPILAIAGARQRAGAAVLLIVTVAVFLSESEAAKLGLIAGCAAAALAFASRTMAIVVLAGITAIVLLAMPLLVSLLYHALPDWFIDIAGARNAWERLEIWRASAALIADTPLFGLGLDSSQAVQFGSAALSPSRFGWLPSGAHHPHNAMLQIWLELGLVGVCLFAAAVMQLLLTIRHLSSDMQPFALGAFAAAMSIAAVSHGAWQSWWVSLLIAVIILFALGRSWRPSDEG